MSDPLAFLEAAHARAKQVAQAAREHEFCKNGHWVAQGPFADRRGIIQSENSEDIIGEDIPWAFVAHMALHDPAAVLRRITNERKILAEHPLDTEASDDIWGYQACQTCLSDREGDPGYDWRPDGWPCVTIRALAEAWGWQPEQQR